jgi:hypothetical protein
MDMKTRIILSQCRLIEHLAQLIAEMAVDPKAAEYTYTDANGNRRNGNRAVEAIQYANEEVMTMQRVVASIDGGE